MAMKIDDKHEANVDSLNLFLINIDFIQILSSSTGGAGLIMFDG